MFGCDLKTGGESGIQKGTYSQNIGSMALSGKTKHVKSIAKINIFSLVSGFYAIALVCMKNGSTR